MIVIELLIDAQEILDEFATATILELLNETVEFPEHAEEEGALQIFHQVELRAIHLLHVVVKQHFFLFLFFICIFCIFLGKYPLEIGIECATIQLYLLLLL